MAHSEFLDWPEDNEMICMRLRHERIEKHVRRKKMLATPGAGERTRRFLDVDCARRFIDSLKGGDFIAIHNLVAPNGDKCWEVTFIKWYSEVDDQRHEEIMRAIDAHRKSEQEQGYRDETIYNDEGYIIGHRRVQLN